MCRPVTSIYACGHIKNAWERCGGDDPAAEPEREPMSHTGTCEMCSPWHEPTATINGWDMCVLRVIVARRHSWKCCECGRVNEADSPSCKGEYMFRHLGAFNITRLMLYRDRICGHPICENCRGVESNGDMYCVDKSAEEVAEEDDIMEMDMDIDDDVGGEGDVEVEGEGDEGEAVEEGEEEAAGSQAVAGHQFSLAFRPRVPPRD